MRIATVVRDWRIGWSQGAIMRAVTTLDRIDPGWQRRAATLQMLGLTERGDCAQSLVCGSSYLWCGMSFAHLGAHKDPATGATWWFAPDTDHTA